MIDRLLLVLVIGITAVAGKTWAEEWRDFKYTDGVVIRARIVSVKDASVTIERNDCRQFTVPVESLSALDQEFVRGWQFSQSPGRGDAKAGAEDGKPVVGKPPSKLKLDPFYEKHVDLDGLPIVSSAKVPDKALLEARKIVVQMTAKDPRLLKTLVRNKVRVAIMASTEVTTDIPEHSDLTPKEQWDRRARGLGATHARPATSGAEENLLALPGDRYKGENIFLHEFAHTLHLMAIIDLDPKFDDRLQKTYADAMAAGLWKGTYAATDHKEYFAEGVQDWFDANLEAKPANGIHNEINTHRELEKYDPALYALIAEWFEKP